MFRFYENRIIKMDEEALDSEVNEFLQNYLQLSGEVGY